MHNNLHYLRMIEHVNVKLINTGVNTLTCQFGYMLNILQFRFPYFLIIARGMNYTNMTDERPFHLICSNYLCVGIIILYK